MSGRPMDRSEYWIRFVCAFIVFGLVAAFSLFRWFDGLGIAAPIVLLCLVVYFSHQAGKRGDEVWRSFFDWFS